MERVDRPPFGCDPFTVGPEQSHREHGTRVNDASSQRIERARRNLIEAREILDRVLSGRKS